MQTLETTAPDIADGIEQVRHREGRVALSTAFYYAIPILVAWLAIVAPIDFAKDLPRWGRACFFLVAWGGAGFVLWWWGIRVLMRPRQDDRIALQIERALPEFRSRYIASVQLARDFTKAPSPALVAALIKETTDIARETDFRRVITTEHLRPWRYVLLATLLAGAVLCWLGGKNTVPLLLRAFLIERQIPRKTQIVAWSGDRTVAIGDDLRLEVSAAGELPFTGTMHIQTPTGAKHQFAIDADPLNSARFFRTLSAVQESFTYSLHIGDNRTPTGRVTVRPRPVVLSTTYIQNWPTYTGRPPQARQPSELKLLAGSQLAVRIKPSVPLASASMLLLGADRKTLQTVALRAEADHWVGTSKIPTKDLTGLTYHLTDTATVESKSMAVTPVTVIPDAAPTIQVTWPPRREELVTNRATLLVAFEAKDDFGLESVQLHYAVNWNEGVKHRTLDLDIGAEGPRSLNRRFEWRLDRIQPPIQEGDVIDYWFEARDNNTETGPGVTIISEHYQARVVSDDEKRADLSARLSDTLSGLNDVRQGQEDLNKRLGDLINALPRGQ